jgi:ribonuclease T1
MPHLGLTSKIKRSSFPRKRESSQLTSSPTQWGNTNTTLPARQRLFDRLDSRFRGNDGIFGAWFRKHLFILLTVLLALTSTQAGAWSHTPNDSEIQIIAVAKLPPEARDTLRLIKQGGPFPYPRDGVVFGNYEQLLPQQPRGYYREYTVKTPGARNRGARRIVCGVPVECYYSSDHYRTFQRIKE